MNHNLVYSLLIILSNLQLWSQASLWTLFFYENAKLNGSYILCLAPLTTKSMLCWTMKSSHCWISPRRVSGYAYLNRVDISFLQKYHRGRWHLEISPIWKSCPFSKHFDTKISFAFRKDYLQSAKYTIYQYGNLKPEIKSSRVPIYYSFFSKIKIKHFSLS